MKNVEEREENNRGDPGKMHRKENARERPGEIGRVRERILEGEGDHE